MSKQTSVEWFSANVWKLTTKLISKEITKNRYAVLYFELHEQAIKMEEEQIIDAFKEGNLYHGWALKHEPEQYYNEIYKKEDK
jgi:hypothetical protein